LDDIIKKLDFGTSQEKITILESLEHTDDFEIIKKIISKLGDDDIQVRGEAFSSLILNKNKISELLIKSLISDNKYVKGYGALVLANRNDVNSIPEIMKLTNDNSSMVRSCALGALGHLRAKQAKDTIEKCMTDPNLEVKKSALQAAILIEDKISENKIREIEKEKDPEIERLLVKIKRKSGPEGI
jgi:HEAT repeat protein